MQSFRNLRFLPKQTLPLYWFTVSALTLCTLPLQAQRAPTIPSTGDPMLFAALPPSPFLDELPNAPGADLANASISSSTSSPQDIPTQPSPAKKLPRNVSPDESTIAAGQIAPSQTVHDKFVMSVRDSISPFNLAGEVISAGYSHVTNGTPNYGTDSAAFGQRLGASVARGTSQNLFYEGVMASVLHEDARYYQLGSTHNFFTRLIYAGTRPILTRTDGGRQTPNLALLSGYLGAAGLAQVYYPPPNQSFKGVMQTWGGSIGGAALGDVVTEFLPGVLEAVHLKKTF